MASHYVPTEYYADVQAEKDQEAASNLTYFTEADFEEASLLLVDMEPAAQDTQATTPRSIFATLGCLVTNCAPSLSRQNRNASGPTWNKKPRKQAVKALYAVIESQLSSVEPSEDGRHFFETLSEDGTLYVVTSRKQNNGRDMIIKRYDGYTEFSNPEEQKQPSSLMLRRQGAHFRLDYLYRLGKPAPSEALAMANDIRGSIS